MTRRSRTRPTLASRVGRLEGWVGSGADWAQHKEDLFLFCLFETKGYIQLKYKSGNIWNRSKPRRITTSTKKKFLEKHLGGEFGDNEPQIKILGARKKKFLEASEQKKLNLL